MAEVTLRDALESIESGSTVKERNKGLVDLKHILRYNQNSSQVTNLDDKSFHKIFDILFNVAVTDQTNFVKAKTKATRSTAANKLSDIASALRGAVEAGVRIIKLKTATAVLDHVCDTIYLSNGDFCEPLALDYAKCMRAVFSHQPHVEHLNREHDSHLKSWGHYARFCIDFIKKAELELVGEDALANGVFISTAGTVNGLSYRSSHSVNRESSGSQGTRSITRPVAEEMIGCVRLLAAAPNAPLREEAFPLLWVIVEALRTSAISSRSHADAFAAINHIVSWSRTEDVAGTQNVISHIVRLVKQLWPQSAAKSAATSNMLAVVLLLQPYIVHAMRQPTGVALRSELAGLVRGLQSEYSKRHERDQLRLDDIRLEINEDDVQDGKVSTKLFTLRCSGGRAESSWLLIHVLAFLHSVIMDDEETSTNQDTDEDDGKIDQRPKKRQRLEDSFTTLLEHTTSGPPSSRSCALQTVAFLAQQKAFTYGQLIKAVNSITVSSGEENGLVSSWAFIAAATCASRLAAADPKFSERWNALWQLASRSLSNTSSCRGASFALHVMLQLRLVSQSHILELVQMITRAMDLSGPAILSDAVATLLQAVLRASHENSPASASATADSIISWLSHSFTPSRMEDKQYAANATAYDASDIIALACSCLNFKCHALRPTGLSVWDVAARNWLFHEDQKQIVSYLLLNPPVDPGINITIQPKLPSKNASLVQPKRTSCEVLVLTHLLSELTRTNEAWSNSRQLSADAFAMLCKAASAVVCIAYCNTYGDTRRQAQVQEQASKFLDSLRDFVASGECEQNKVDTFLSVFSSVFSNCNRRQRDAEHQPCSKCERIICQAIHTTLTRRAGLSSQIGDDDAMDLDEMQDSQSSRQGLVSPPISELTNDLDVAYSKMTLRSSAFLYANALVMTENGGAQLNNTPSASTQTTDFVLAQPIGFILSSRDVISSLSEIGLTLSLEDTDRLLDFFLGLGSKYAHSMSEVALGAALDIMTSLIGVWTDPSDEVLFDLGIQAYEWFAGSAMNGQFLSPNVLKRLATLLLELSRVDPDYGKGSKAGTAWTCLFSAIPKAPVVVQYTLASCVPAIFGSFVLGKHEEVFEDLLGNLPDDVVFLEGIAIRLMFLSNLASAWRSLLRICVYYIFESAGRIEGSTQHAAHCIKALAASLSLMTPQKLFTLFSPQLLHTWFDTKQPLERLPFTAFQYSSLHELLRVNQAEVLAQLTMRGDEGGMNLMTKALRMFAADAVKRSYARCVAYCIGHDVSTKHAGGSNNPVEERLRNTIGGKAEHNRLIQEQFPTIVGYFYLTIQQDDPQDSWLEKRAGFDAAWSALVEMKSHSHSTTSLPVCQEPSLKGKYLGDELERLCRRLGTTPQDCWTPSTLSLTIRMLFDAVDQSLGSLHSALMVRRLRILIATANGVATDGLALEVLIHSLRPFLNDSECADDVLGILQYLFDHGKLHIGQNVTFATGAVILLILQMRKHSRSRHDRTTQESQHTATVSKMLAMQKWLVNYLNNLNGNGESPAYEQLIGALGGLQLPGNAMSGSAESTVLLFLLDQWSSDEPLCSRADSIEALSLLSEDFEIPASLNEDCLGGDGEAACYGQTLWETMGTAVLTDNFIAWAAGVLGRGYASTGLRSARTGKQKPFHVPSISAGNDGSTTKSKSTIVEHLCHALYSRRRAEAGLAEFTLRKVHEAFAHRREPEESIEFQQLLPSAVYSAVYDGNYGYEPSAVMRPNTTASNEGAIEQALQVCRTGSIESWATTLAMAICNSTPGDATVSSLGPFIQNTEGLSLDLLPSMIHILLVKEIDSPTSTLRSTISSAASLYLADIDLTLQPKQQFWLNLLLYLKSQPYPGEKTKADRLEWLDVDFMVAAGAASRCGMPACALMLAESAAPEAVATITQSNRRASSRVSFSQLQQPRPPDDLLLSIYKQMEEPDSFYGVQQEASLDSVLGRLDHEANGFRSLMFRSAQMDSHMRHLHQMSETDATGMVQSLSTLSFNSLAFALVTRGIGNAKNCSSQMLNAAQTLQQWDIAPLESPGESSLTFSVFQELSRTGDVQQIRNKSHRTILEHVKTGLSVSKSTIPASSWYSVLASLTEITEITSASSEAEMISRWQVMQNRQHWMHMARFEDVSPVLTSRQTLFGVLGQNLSLRKGLHLSHKQCRAFEVDALLSSSKFAREHSRLQEALAASTTLSDMVDQCKAVDLDIEAAVKVDTATVMWDSGETTASVNMLRDALALVAVAGQAFPVGHSGLLAQLGHQLAEARLEKPEGIYSEYLKPAISYLRKNSDPVEVGKVYFEFATFCDKELQNPGNIESLNRIVKLRQGKEDEIEAIQQAIKNAKKTGADRHELSRSLGRADQWRQIDTAEEKRLRDSRDEYVKQSLQNYLFALKASDEHDICVLRFFALWLESSGDDTADGTVLKCLPQVPSWKFVRLMNQLMSRLEDGTSTFQQALGELMFRIFKEHPLHSLHHLFAASVAKPQGDTSGDHAASSRYKAAKSIAGELSTSPQHKDLLRRVFSANHKFKAVAESAPDLPKGGSKVPVKDFYQAKIVATSVPEKRVPPITITLPLKPSADYSDAPVITKFDSICSIMGGLSAPKMLKAYASDGKTYKELFKSGKDDLRQDAIMEQVFEEVSNMLQNHKSTRQRDLKVRTYKVIPLAKTSGVIEFVPNSIPINDYLRPAHRKYHPQSMTDNKARDEINRAYQAGSFDKRLKAFQNVCSSIPPVMRHFFFERYDDPDEWFHKRTAYTRTTASVSILGHILGLGDRHCSNILLDEQTGEVVHIDLGVAFEMGRVLPIPELIPFRLTRDIIDGMGATGTEGVFRRCCEFTLDAVRDDKDSIMTLLNVLRYDPLYEWSVSPLRAKRMQEAHESSRNGGVLEQNSSKKEEQSAGEAERALAIVEKKLAKTLSTTAMVNELIQQATDEKNLAVLFQGWAAYF